MIDDTAYQPKPAEVIAIIREVLPELAQRNLTLGIENHDRFKATELAGIMEAVGSERVGSLPRLRQLAGSQRRIGLGYAGVSAVHG